jgi:hypothetical protein
MNETALVQKVWNYAHVLRDQGVPYQAYISQISYLLFLKMDDERAGLVASGLIKGENSAIPEDCRWAVLRDLQGEELTRRDSAILGASLMPRSSPAIGSISTSSGSRMTRSTTKSSEVWKLRSTASARSRSACSGDAPLPYWRQDRSV